VAVTKDVIAKLSCSGRKACQALKVSRSVFYYERRNISDKRVKLKFEVVKLSQKYPTMGYKKITALLRKSGLNVSKKFVQKIRREECLQVPTKKPKTRRQGLSTGIPTKATHKNHVWSWDFMYDYTQRGGAIKVFNLIDEYTRECYAIHIDRTLRSEDVRSVMIEMVEEHGAPEYIRSDNGSEFIASTIQEFLKSQGIKTLYIEPGSPWQNGFTESFNSKLRNEFFERELIYTLMEARVMAEDWRKFYNYERPHCSLGMMTPKEFAQAQSKSATFPRESNRDVYDRYNPIDIYQSKNITLNNNKTDFILT
jgi:putative transposase